MVQLIKPQEVRIQTVEDEATVKIVLDLNINLDQEGLKALALQPDPKLLKALGMREEVEEITEPIIPDFTSEKINFGKKI
jgi:hypothetical protein